MKMKVHFELIAGVDGDAWIVKQVKEKDKEETKIRQAGEILLLVVGN